MVYLLIILFFLYLLQFNPMKGQGTRIIVYNLWEDDQGLLELDFDADPHVTKPFNILYLLLVFLLYLTCCYMIRGFRVTCFFHSLLQDIQIRGVNRDERSIQMAKQYPNSRHFLTYRHSLRVSNNCSAMFSGSIFVTRHQVIWISCYCGGSVMKLISSSTLKSK